MDQAFWTNMVVQSPVMETNRGRSPTPVPRSGRSHSLLDGEKTGAALMCFGAFLVFVGVAFTTMGWHQYQTNPSFEWTQLLGPIMISVGGIFVLTSVFKFGNTCWPCRWRDEEELVMPQTSTSTSTGHSFTLSGMNAPIMLPNATAMICVPPLYDFIPQDVRQASGFQPGGHVNAARPPHDAVFCVDNTAFTAEEEDSSAHSTETDRGKRMEKTEHDRGRPPVYEDIYPSF